jgi:hypothetical protein
MLKIILSCVLNLIELQKVGGDMKRFMLAIFALCVLHTPFLCPQETSSALGVYTYPQLKVDFPLFDLPYQIDAAHTTGNFFTAYSTFSMNQSLSLTADVYSAMHFGMRKLYEKLPFAPVWNEAIFYGGTAAGLLAFGYILPFGYSWMQQEYTRSILTRFNIDSRNGAYDISKSMPVNGVTDDDLVHLKAENPHNFIRMEAANIEGYVLFSSRMLRNRFLYDLHDLSNLTALLSALLVLPHSTIAYVDKYGFMDVDKIINDNYNKDGVQNERGLHHFSGINWVYDLFRPDETYTARGPHPSGDGSVARYITLAQLSEAEKDYLIKQGLLSFLNLSSPMLYGFNTFSLGKTGIEWNLALNHYFTSFGSDTPFQVLLKKAPFNMVFTWHSYMNYEHYFPAVEAELLDYPVRFTPKFGLFLSPRLMIGMQPKDQNFWTSDAEFLGLFGLRLEFGFNKHFFPYFDLSTKTDGWIAGNEYLEGNVSLKAGVSLRF